LGKRRWANEFTIWRSILLKKQYMNKRNDAYQESAPEEKRGGRFLGAWERYDNRAFAGLQIAGVASGDQPAPPPVHSLVTARNHIRTDYYEKEIRTLPYHQSKQIIIHVLRGSILGCCKM
jgi:hypothetical protein